MSKKTKKKRPASTAARERTVRAATTFGAEAAWLPSRSHRVLLVAILVAYVLASRLLLWSYGPVDDAFISFRYAHHLASEQGLTFNPGERVEGYSSLSWVLILAVADKLGLDLPETSKWLGLLLGMGTLLLLSAGPFDARSRLLAEALLAGFPPAAYHFVNGLETSLMAFLVTALVLLPSERLQARWVHYVVGVLLVLTRPEGLLCVLLWIACLWIADRRRISRHELTLGAITIATYGAQTAFRWWATGDWMASSARAKLLPPGFALPKGLLDLLRFLVPGSAWGLLLLLLGLGAWMSWRRREGSESRTFLALALFVVLFGLALAVSGGDSFPLWRFYVPLAPLFFLCAARGLTLAIRSRALWATATVVIFAVLWLPLPVYLRRMQGEALWARRWTEIGKSLAQRFPPGTRIALCPVGALPFYSGLPTIDMLGLNEPHIARREPDRSYFYPGHQRHDGRYVLSLRPDLIMLANGPVFPGPEYPFPWREVRVYERDVVLDPRFPADYRLIHLPLESGGYAELFARAELLARTGEIPGVTVSAVR